MALLGFSLRHALAYGFTGNGDGFAGNGFPELRRPRGGAQKFKKKSGGALERLSFFSQRFIYFILIKKISRKKARRRRAHFFFARFTQIAWVRFPIEGAYVLGLDARECPGLALADFLKSCEILL